MQSLVRSMPDLHKTLILANLRRKNVEDDDYIVEELAMATEHAPFRHRTKLLGPGTQRKKQKVNTVAIPQLSESDKDISNADSNNAEAREDEIH